MNMISTGAFQNEMDASSKTETLVSKLVSAWEKKNAKVARAGGVSLMALSLAACGSSDDDTTADSGTTTTVSIKDTDGDGMIDSKDAFPNDATETVDTDGDGVGDNADAYPNDATNTPPVDANKSVSLTNIQDTVSGGSGDDNFSGVVQANGATGTTAFPGDQIDGGAGSDTLTISFAGNATGAYTLSAIDADNVETILASNFETNAGASTIDTSLMEGYTTLGIAAGSATGDTVFSNVIAVTDASMSNSAADLTLTYAATAVVGVTDVQDVSLSNNTAGTLTFDGIETISVTTHTAKSTVEALASDALKTLTITGDQNLKVNAALDFAANGTAAAPGAVIDASGMTGALTITTTASEVLDIKTGSGNDTVTAGSLTATDKLDMGAGVDRVVVDASETAVLTGTTNVEEIEFQTEDIMAAAGNAANPKTISGLAVPSATNFVIDANTAADDDEAFVAITNLDDGDTVTILEAGADSTNVAAGVNVTTAFTTDTPSNSLNLVVTGIGAVTANNTADTGVSRVEMDEVETLNITANVSTANVKLSQMETLEIALGESVTVNGAGTLTVDNVINTTKLTSLDASGMTGKLNLTGLDASALTFKMAQDATVATMAGVTNADHIVGGASTSDSLTALAVTGLTATTGKLNIQDVETVIVQATGANTIDASLMTGATLAISGATPGTQTVTNVGSGLTAIQLGEATGAGAAFDNGALLAVSLADATGTADALTINVENDAAGTDAALDISGVENLTLHVSTLDTNNATVDLTEAEATSVTVTGGKAGTVLALDNLDEATNIVDISAYAGEVTFSGVNVTSGMTVTASSSAAADNFTLSGRADTITVGSTAAVDVDVDGGAGLDVLNLTVTTGFVDTGEIDNVETINFTVAAGTDISIGANGAAATDANGIADATAISITGGNSLSTFEIGDANNTAADNITAATNIDASTFEGNINVEYNTAILTSAVSVKGGSLTTDTVRAIYDATNTDVSLNMTGVETFLARLNSGNDAANEQYTFDLDKNTGLVTLGFDSSDGENTLVDIDNYVNSVKVQLGSQVTGTAVVAFDSSSEVDINHANQFGTSDEVKLHLLDSDDQAGTIDIDAAGTETLTISSGTAAQSHKLNLDGVTATTGSTVDITITGGVAGDGIELTSVATGTSSIDGSAHVGTLTVTDRPSTAMTIKGGTEADSLRMEHSDDVMSGSTGVDTIVVEQTAIVGAAKVDLSATGDQVTSFNGTANAAVQSGFENVDMSSYTGSGADITAVKQAAGTSGVGSIITGSSEADVITLGNGTDVVRLQDGTTDTIKSFTLASDEIELGLANLESAGTSGIFGVAVTFTELHDDNRVAAAGTPAVTDLVSGANTAVGDASNIYVLLTNTFASTDAVETAIEDGGTHEMVVTGGVLEANDAAFLVYSDGANTHLAAVRFTADQDAVNIGVGESVVRDIAILNGVGGAALAASEIVAANFDFIA